MKAVALVACLLLIAALLQTDAAPGTLRGQKGPLIDYLRFSPCLRSTPGFQDLPCLREVLLKAHQGPEGRQRPRPGGPEARRAGRPRHSGGDQHRVGRSLLSPRVHDDSEQDGEGTQGHGENL